MFVDSTVAAPLHTPNPLFSLLPFIIFVVGCTLPCERGTPLKNRYDRTRQIKQWQRLVMDEVKLPGERVLSGQVPRTCKSLYCTRDNTLGKTHTRIRYG